MTTLTSHSYNVFLSKLSHCDLITTTSDYIKLKLRMANEHTAGKPTQSVTEKLFGLFDSTFLTLVTTLAMVLTAIKANPR